MHTSLNYLFITHIVAHISFELVKSYCWPNTVESSNEFRPIAIGTGSKTIDLLSGEYPVTIPVDGVKEHLVFGLIL